VTTDLLDCYVMCINFRYKTAWFCVVKVKFYSLYKLLFTLS